MNVLVDANNLLHRSIGTSNNWLERNNYSRKIDKNGTDVSSLQKFISDLYHCTEEFHNTETQIFLVWDRKLDKTKTNWRKEVNPRYKSNRDGGNTQRKEVHELCVHVKRVTELFGFINVFPLESEGDDIIHYLKETLTGDSIIISADQDFYQCVSENCSVYNLQKRFTLTLENFEEHVPVPLKDYVLWKAIKGDPSDNLSGLYNYGEKRSKALIDNWETGIAKLNEDDLLMIEETKSLIQLGYKPLSKKEVEVIEAQNKPREKSTDDKLTKVLDAYGISLSVRQKWDKYFEMKELNNLFGS